MAGKDVELMSGSTVDIGKGTPAQFNWPSRHLLDGENREYFNICVPLTNAAFKGDIGEAKSLIEMNQHESILCSAITEGYETILHVAAGAGQINIVQEIVEMMKPEDLLLQDINGNTAFCFAAMAGSIQIGKIMLEKNPSLLTVRGGQNMTPVYLAALFEQSDMAKFLYHETNQNLEEGDRKAIFFVSIKSELYDLALKLLEDDTELAVARHVEYGTAMHILAQKPSAFVSRSRGLLNRLSSSFSATKFADQEDTVMTSAQVLKLVKLLWGEILKRKDEDVVELIRYPSNVLFDAAKSGNFKFLAELIRSYPDLVHELDENDRTIFHVAVLHGHTNILNLIHEIGFAKDLLMTYVDKDGNSILHLVAKYQNPSSMTSVSCTAQQIPDKDGKNIRHRAAKYQNTSPMACASGTALQIQERLLKFKEVEKIVKPSFREKKNSVGKTPRELLILENSELFKRGELSMKKTANSCLIIASLVATVIFAAAFSLPGGNNDETGRSVNTRGDLLQVFVVVKAMALSSSLISTLIFLSIVTWPCAEDDFLWLLPLKLKVGLLGLYVSIITMFMGFSSVFFR